MRCTGLVVLLLAWITSPLAAAEPVRVVALAPHLAEIVCEVAGCERLVGVVAHTDWPEAAAAKPRVGDAWRVDYERVLELAPDLVLAWPDGTPPQTVTRLERLGVEVRWLPTGDLARMADSFELAGQWLGEPERGAAVAEAFRERLAGLRREHEDAEPLRVLYQLGRQPLYTISAASPIDEAIRVCGGRNVFGDLAPVAAPVSVEAVIARAPEVIVHGTDSGPGIRSDWMRRPGVPAVRDRAFVEVNADWMNRPTPRMLDGIEQLCEGMARVRAAR